MAPNTFRIAANTRFPPTPLGVPVQTLVRRCLLLDNMVPARELQKENERKEFEVRLVQARTGSFLTLTHGFEGRPGFKWLKRLIRRSVSNVHAFQTVST